MKSSEIPQGPLYNPMLEEGLYDATIVCLKNGTYGADKDPYIQVVMRLPKPNRHFVSNFYLPTSRPNAKTVKRLARLCQCIGLVPQDALDNPKEFEGRELKITVKQC